jgi:hypothetical protein
MEHYFNFQGNEIFGVLAFLGACLGLLLAAIAFVYLWITRRHQLANRLLQLMVAGAGVYFGTLLAYSFTSCEQVLDLNEEKYFCEVDCHLAYSVITVTKTKTLGPPPNQSTAQGAYYVVTVKTRFDERTISPTRGNFPLMPNPRTVTIIDSEGRHYGASPEGQRALESIKGENVPLTQPLRPGEFYTTDLVFDLPSDVKDLHLLMTEADWITHLLIGHENSFFHKKTSFRLESPTTPTTAQIISNGSMGRRTRHDDSNCCR